MRKYVIPSSINVEYLLGDHLGSTSLTTDTDGAKVSEIRSSWTSGVAATPAYKLNSYTFTGQFSYMDDPTTTGVEEGFGLLFYNARWYDPYLNHFTQPDTIVPDPYNPQAWDHYAYVSNNPIRNNDPTGHCENFWDCITPDAIVFSGVASFAFPGSKTIETFKKEGFSSLSHPLTSYAQDYIIMSADVVHTSWDDTGTPFITRADSKNNQEGNAFVTLQASFSMEVTVLWGDVFTEKGAQAYSGDAYNTSVCAGGAVVGGCGGLVQAVSDKMNNTRTLEDYKGVTGAFTLGFPSASFQTYPSTSSTNPSLQQAYSENSTDEGKLNFWGGFFSEILDRIDHHWD
jgi:RHS repeat-associated protein